jgi:hypothetical protein
VKRYLWILLGSIALIFGAVALLNAAVDPFGYWRTTAPGKAARASAANVILYKALDARRWAAGDAFIVGDSRAGNLPDFPAACDAIYNFSFGGANFEEAYSAAQFAADQLLARRIVFEISPSFLFAYRNSPTDRFVEIQPFLENPFVYLIAPLTTGLSLDDLGGAPTKSLVPDVSRESFWQSQLVVARQVATTRFMFAQRFAKLRALKKKLKRNGGDLVIYIPPSHIDMTQIFAAAMHDPGISDFAARLSHDFLVLDFDYPNDFTRDAGNFYDPWHPNRKAFRDLSRELGGLVSGRVCATPSQVIPHRIWLGGKIAAAF